MGPGRVKPWAIFLLSIIACFLLGSCNSEGGNQPAQPPLSTIDNSPALVTITSASGATLVATSTKTPTVTLPPTKLATTVPTATPTPPPIENQIAFFYLTEGTNGYLCTMNPDGSGLRFLVDIEQVRTGGSFPFPDREDTFSWSPDGAWIAYASREGGNYDLYAIDVEGTTKIRLTDTGDDERFPSWSPDGRYIAYGIHTKAFVLDLETMQSQQIFEINGLVTQFDWSSDSNILTYTAVGQPVNKWEIIGHVRENNFEPFNGFFVPYSGFRVGSLTWAPDGERFAYSANNGGLGNMGLFGTTLPERSNPTLLISYNVDDDHFDIDWSPDASTLVYAVEEDSISDIYRISSEGESQLQLTEFEINDSRKGGNHDPVWSYDGSLIAYLSSRDGVDEIYVMNPDGSEKTKITNTPGRYSSLQWQPQGDEGAPLSRSDGLPLPPPKATVTPYPTATEIGASVPGRAIEEIIRNLEDNQYVCENNPGENNWAYSTHCESQNGNLLYEVDVFANTPGQFNEITATVTQLDGAVDGSPFSDFLSFVATLPFLAQPQLQDQARTELVDFYFKNNMGWMVSLNFGDVDFEVEYLEEDTLKLSAVRIGG